jgi:DAACS family dicarboxylate/amino acid:cation (Na+ or H+) symporter
MPAELSQHVARRRWPLHVRILIGLLVGMAVGLTCNGLATSGVMPREKLDFIAEHVAKPLGNVFLQLILMVVVPLVVSALALGVLGLGDVRRLGRVGLRTLFLTVVLSGIAVALGLFLVNTIRPGASLSQAQREKLEDKQREEAKKHEAKAQQAKSLAQTLLDIIPKNPLQEAVGALDGSSPGNGMLAVMFFALTLGVALAQVGPRGETLVRLLEGLFDVSMVIIGWAMRLAPYAVACLVFSLTAQLGFDILLPLGLFVGTALLGMALHMFVVYSFVVWRLGRRSPGRFFADVSEAMFTAFGTASSNATLPTTLRVANENLRLPNDISRFVLTIGATGNQNGTALYEGVVVLFLAQLYGVHLTLPQQLTVVLMSVLAGVGTAGVPGGSIPLIIIVLKSVGVPADGIGIILGVDRLLDMCRTVLNVTGDLVLATCVAERSGKAQPTPQTL